jgi:hypothetical protein
MSAEETNKKESGQPPFTPARTGNASNPSPETGLSTVPDKQLLDEKAETYLRESGNIEDLPDPREETELDKSVTPEED